MDNAAIPLVRRLCEGRSEIVSDGARVETRSLEGALFGTIRALRDRGVSPQDRVLVLVKPGPDLVVLLLALVWLGAVPVLVEPTQAALAFHARISAVRPRFAVVDPRLRWLWRLPFADALRGALFARRGAVLPPRPDVPCVISMPTPVRGPALPPALCAPEDPALVLFTSGTTSAPRVVQHTHNSLTAFLGRVRSVVEGLSVASYLAETPQQMFYALLLDATCHVVSGTGDRRLRRTLSLLETGQVEAWFGGPWTWVRWLDALQRGDAAPVPATLRTVLLGSAPVTRPFLRRLLPMLPEQTAVRCVYGLTEAGPVAMVCGRRKAEREESLGDWVGAPMEGVLLRAVDTAVSVRSDSVPASLRDEDGWLSTGDLGQITEEGLYLLGRGKDMIVRRGVNLYPGILEPLLDDDEVALVGIYDPRLCDEQLVLFSIRPLPRARIERLGADAQPDQIWTIDALPRSGRQHKVDKEALRVIARSRLGIPA